MNQEHTSHAKWCLCRWPQRAARFFVKLDCTPDETLAQRGMEPEGGAPYVAYGVRTVFVRCRVRCLVRCSVRASRDARRRHTESGFWLIFTVFVSFPGFVPPFFSGFCVLTAIARSRCPRRSRCSCRSCRCGRHFSLSTFVSDRIFLFYMTGACVLSGDSRGLWGALSRHAQRRARSLSSSAK